MAPTSKSLRFRKVAGGLGGQTIDTKKISKLIGATQGPKRLAEARENAAELKATRVS